METTDSNLGSLTGLPTHSRNPALSTPWHTPLLISSFPLCLPNQARLLPSIPTKKRRMFSKNHNILASEAKSHLVCIPQKRTLSLGRSHGISPLPNPKGSCSVPQVNAGPFSHATFSQDCREENSKRKSTDRSFVSELPVIVQPDESRV